MSLFVQLNSNLGNYPLARDPNTHHRWWYSEKLKVWVCDLPGEPLVQYRMPRHARRSERRLPTAFDMNVLFYLLAVAYLKGSSTITFSTQAEVLRDLKVESRTSNRDKLLASLELWSTIVTRHKEWWLAKQGSNSRKLRPPIVAYSFEDELSVTLDMDWLELDKGYLTKVTLPLPMKAAEQNLVLMLFARKRRPRPVRTTIVCRKIGMTHRWATKELRKRTLPRVKHWFDQSGLCFGENLEPGFRKFDMSLFGSQDDLELWQIKHGIPVYGRDNSEVGHYDPDADSH